MLVDQYFCKIFKQMENIFIHIFKVFENTFRRSFDDIFWLRDTNSFKSDTCLVLNFLNELVSLFGVESNACSSFSSSCSSSRSMDVRFSVFWWFNLNNKIYIFNIKTSGGNICCNQDLKFTLLESLHCDFSLILSNITMHNLNILLYFIR